MDTLNFKVTPLGQTVLRYEVPLDVYNIINQIYETKYPTLPPANKQLEAIKNSFNYKDLCYYLKYDDLVSNPEHYIKEVYKFLDIPYYPHQFKNLQQVNINGLGYNDGVMGKNMHTIRNEIKKEYNSYIEKIPQTIREKYGHIRF